MNWQYQWFLLDHIYLNDSDHPDAILSIEIFVHAFIALTEE